MNKEKQLTILLLTEKLQKLTNKKVILEGRQSKTVKAAIAAVKTINILRHELYSITKDDNLFNSFDNAIEQLQQMVSNK